MAEEKLEFAIQGFPMFRAANGRSSYQHIHAAVQQAIRLVDSFPYIPSSLVILRRYFSCFSQQHVHRADQISLGLRADLRGVQIPARWWYRKYGIVE